MTDKSTKIILYFILASIIGFALWSIFSQKNKSLIDAINKLNEARTRIDSAQKSLDKVLVSTDSILNRNTDFKSYIHAVDSVVKLSDEKSRQREQRYLQNINLLDKNIEKLKIDLAKMNNKLPELENGTLSNNPN